jgi:tetratricopeptide (TPR) repeat protein
LSGVNTERPFANGSPAAVAVALAAVLLFTPTRAWAQTADALNREATKAIEAGKLDAALADLRRAAKLAPSNRQVQFNLGLTLLRLGKLSEAIAPLQRAKQDAKLAPEAGFLLGVDYFEAKDYAKAISELQNLNIPAHAERTLYMLEESNRLTGRLAQARDAFRELNQRFPDSAWTHYLMANAYEAEEQLDKAVDEYKQALERDPSIPNANFAIGYIYWRQQNTEEAEQWLQKQASSGCHALANYFLGEIARVGKDLQKAERHYRQSLQCDPSHADSHLRLGMVLGEEKRYPEAIAQLKEAIRLKPDQSPAHYHLAVIYRRTGQTAKAQAEYNLVRRIQAAAGERMGTTDPGK